MLETCMEERTVRKNLIAFMAGLPPEHLEKFQQMASTWEADETGGASYGASYITIAEIEDAYEAVKAVRTAEAALAPKKPGRPKGSRRKVEVSA